MMKPTTILLAGLVLAPLTAFASDAVQGTETSFTSPNGVIERCVRIAPIPGGDYGKDDLDEEEGYCAIDFYAPPSRSAPRRGARAPA